MLKVKTDVKAYARQLKRISDDLLPRATAGAINRVATLAHKESERNIKGRFTVRNQYTVKSLKYYKANPKKDINRINAISGSISPYLPIQDEGGKVRAKKNRIAIPTKAGRRGNWGRPIPPSLRIDAMRAGSSGSKYFLLGPAKKFRPRKGRSAPRLQQPGIFYRQRKKLSMVRDLSMQSYKLSPRRWHTDAMKKFGRRPLMEQAFVKEAKALLRSLK